MPQGPALAKRETLEPVVQELETKQPKIKQLKIKQPDSQDRETGTLATTAPVLGPSFHRP